MKVELTFSNRNAGMLKGHRAANDGAERNGLENYSH